MSKFNYTAKSPENKIINGFIDAQSVAEAAAKLENSGFTVLNINFSNDDEPRQSYEFHTSHDINTIPPFSLKQKSEFFNSFYSLYSSGLSILETFQSMYKSASDKFIKSLCNKIVNSVKKGNSLEVSFRNYSHCLGIAYTNLIITGEKSGKLESILDEIINNIERETDFRNNAASSMAYPCCIFVMGIAVFLFFKFFVIKVFTSIDNPLSSSEIVDLLIWAVIKTAVILFGFAAVIFVVIKNKKLSSRIVDFLSKLPIFSSVMKKYDLFNFFQVASLAYNAGIPANQTVDLASSVISLSAIKSSVKLTVKMISHGCNISTAFAASRIFSPFDLSQISAGEKSGELDKMFKVVSQNYEKQFDTSVKVIVRLIEPVMIIFAGILVFNVCYNAYKSYYDYLFNMI